MSNKKFFSKKSSKIITMVLAVTLIVTAFAVFISGTFAAKSPINKTFENPNPTGYTLVEAGVTLAPRSVSGSINFASSNTSIATVTAAMVGNLNHAVVSGVKAGAVAIASSSKTGGILSLKYQVYDDSEIESYSLSNGGEIVIANVGSTANINDGSFLTATSGGGDNVKGNIEWTSINTDIATVTLDGFITAVAKGGAMLIGTVTDKWGVERQIPVLVLVGNSSNNLIDCGNGHYYISTDNPYIFVESDKDGQIKIPPSYVYDKDKNPANGVDGLAYEKGGEFYVEDSANSNIYKKIDKVTGNKIENPALWGGTTLGLGNDSNEQPIVQYGTSYYIDNGDNTFWGPIYGVVKGTLVGGGTDYNPVTTPVSPIYTDVGGKHYVGPIPVDGDQVYYGDPADGMLDSNAAGTKKDDIVFYKLDDGTMITTKPEDGATKGSDGNWYIPVGGGVWQETDATGKNPVHPEKYIGGGQTPDPSKPLYKITAADNDKKPPAKNYSVAYHGYLTTTPSGNNEYDTWQRGIADYVKVTSVVVKELPQTTIYTEGNKFNPTGLTIKVTYADGRIEEKPYYTPGITYSPSTGLTTADTIITITYEGKTAFLPITIKPAIPSGMREAGITGSVNDLGKSFTINGIEWQIVKKNGASNDFLIVTTGLHNDINGNKPVMMNDGRNWNTYENQDLYYTMETWYKGKCLELMPIAMKATLPIEESYKASVKDTNALSYPTRSANGETKGIIFPLSISELNLYQGVNKFSKAAKPVVSASGTSFYMTRSPGNTEANKFTTAHGAYCNSDGTVFSWHESKAPNFTGTNPSPQNNFMRPAMWIHIDPQ